MKFTQIWPHHRFLFTVKIQISGNPRLGYILIHRLFIIIDRIPKHIVDTYYIIVLDYNVYDLSM